MKLMRRLPEVLLLLLALCTRAGTPSLPAGFDTVVVGENLQENGITTDIYQFLRNESADQTLAEIRAFWQSHNAQPMFESRIGNDLVLSQQLGEYWQTVRITHAPFGRSVGLYSSAHVFAQGARAKPQLPFELPSGTKMARHTHSRDLALASDTWLLTNHDSVATNAGMLQARMKVLGAQRDATVRYPGPPDKAWAGAFRSKTDQWMMTVHHDDTATYVVINRVQKDQK
jgi:hypothetical protein